MLWGNQKPQEYSWGYNARRLLSYLRTADRRARRKRLIDFAEASISS